MLYPVECKPGYAGPNCSFNCPYPLYGDGCQGECECSKDECDYVTGCKPMSSGTFVCYISPLCIDHYFKRTIKEYIY